MEKSNAVIAVFPDQQSADSAVRMLTAAGLATGGLYDAALKADNFLVMAHGQPEEISRAKTILVAANPASIDLYPTPEAAADEPITPADPVMLWNASDIEGCGIAATDGQIGTVCDLLFDDSDWSIRWLVVETGNWLVGRKVLIPVTALWGLDPRQGQITVGLTMQQVKEGPDIYAHSHLRSVDAVRGYRIHARDGDIGHLKDVLLADSDWGIHYLVVDTENWWPGKTVLIAPKSARKIDWATNRIDLNVDRQKVKNSPEYDPSKAVDGAYERDLDSYYGE